MKKNVLLLMLLLMFSLPMFSETKPRIVVMDIMSDTMSTSEIKMFTDILRTELYKLDYFNIVERGVIQQYLEDSGFENTKAIEDSSLLSLGKSLNVEKLMVCTMNSYADTNVVNIRIIDTESSNLDYTENIFLQNQNQTFDALKDLVLKIELNYIERAELGDPLSARDKLRKTWKLLGADDNSAEKLSGFKLNPSNYMDMRQYDINFTPANYLEVYKAGYDEVRLIEFFQEGISFNFIKKAFSLGVVDLKNYKENFKRENYSFAEYLDAYEHHIMTPEDYAEYKKGYKKLEYLLGAGGVANALPITNADTKFFLLQGGVEYYISDYQRGFSKTSAEMGIYLMNAFLPAPYFQVNMYMGKFPFYGKLSVGGHAELLFGGSAAAFVKLGAEVNSLFEFSFMVAFAGTQPEVSYVGIFNDQKTKEDEGYVDIDYPYMAATFLYKF